MEQATSQIEKDSNYDQDLVRRRAFLAAQFQALPSYGSAELWSRIEESQLKLALPLEVLVKCIRVAVPHGDSAGKLPGSYPSDGPGRQPVCCAQRSACAITCQINGDLALVYASR
jgi:hypothetical protein